MDLAAIISATRDGPAAPPGAGLPPVFSRLRPDEAEAGRDCCAGRPDAPFGVRVSAAEQVGRRPTDTVAAKAALDTDSFELQLFNSAAPDWGVRFQDLPEAVLRLAMASGGPAAAQQLSTTVLGGLLETVLGVLHLPYSLLTEEDRQALLAEFARVLPVKAGESGVLLELRRSRSGPPELSERQLPALCEYLGASLVLHEEGSGKSEEGSGKSDSGTFETLCYAPHRPVLLLCRRGLGRYRAVLPQDQPVPGAGAFSWARHHALLSHLVRVPLPESIDLRLLSAEQAREFVGALGLGQQDCPIVRLRKAELLELLRHARPTIDELLQARASTSSCKTT